MNSPKIQAGLIIYLISRKVKKKNEICGDSNTGLRLYDNTKNLPQFVFFFVFLKIKPY